MVGLAAPIHGLLSVNGYTHAAEAPDLHRLGSARITQLVDDVTDNTPELSIPPYIYGFTKRSIRLSRGPSVDSWTCPETSRRGPLEASEPPNGYVCNTHHAIVRPSNLVDPQEIGRAHV